VDGQLSLMHGERICHLHISEVLGTHIWRDELRVENGSILTKRQCAREYR
jgi:hypothetical protein